MVNEFTGTWYIHEGQLLPDFLPHTTEVSLRLTQRLIIQSRTSNRDPKSDSEFNDSINKATDLSAV
ncbi:hypothetical protein CSKR_200816, partial [Clonorchis sinensis]